MATRGVGRVLWIVGVMVRTVSAMYASGIWGRELETKRKRVYVDGRWTGDMLDSD